MGQQSQNSWPAGTYPPSDAQSPSPKVADWMESVLGQGDQPSVHARPDQKQWNPGEQPPSAPQGGTEDLQSRLAAIAHNIQTLEDKVATTIGGDQPLTTREPVVEAASTDRPLPTPAADPLEALRRRKRELEMARPSAVSPKTDGYPPEPDALTSPAQSNAVAEQLDRITAAIGDVRSMTQSGIDEQDSLRSQLTELEARFEGERSGSEDPQQSELMEQLGDKIGTIQDAIAAMPKPEAMRSLEEGYNHILERIDSLKSVDLPSDRIDALYRDVDALRDVLDKLVGSDAGDLLGEMRTLVARLEETPQEQTAKLTEALAGVQELTERSGHGDNGDDLREAMGVIVERLVALEARIEALVHGTGDAAVAQRLESIESEMTRLSALERIEQTTGGYAENIADLVERLANLDAKIGNQSDMAQEVASIARELESFQSVVPVREIEHALLDLTGRVTALQEDTASASVAEAVNVLGEKVESCLGNIPSAGAIIEAVETKIDERIEGSIDPLVERIDGLDRRLGTVQQAISINDGPLVEHIAQRLSDLVASMPATRAEQALVSLEAGIAELNKRQAASGMVSRDDVEQLRSELARVSASVELGTNQDIQRTIVDQVGHLADRFDIARESGDAAVLPEIESEVSALAERVQSMGLFEAPGKSQSGGDAGANIGQQIDQDDPAPIARLPEIELSKPDKAPPFDLPEPVDIAPPPIEQPAPAFSIEDNETSPAPGDAQDLIKQLSGALDVPEPEQELDGANTIEPEEPSRSPGLSSTASDQRASFIAAARRAAQAAALQAGGADPGRGAKKESSYAGVEATVPFAEPEPATEIAEKIEPSWGGSEAPDGAQVEADETSSPLDGRPESKGQLEAPAKAGKKAKKKKAESRLPGKPKRQSSRALILALLLFVVAGGLYAISLIAQTNSSDTDVEASLPAEEAPSSEVPATNEGASLSQLDTAQMPEDSAVGGTQPTRSDQVVAQGTTPIAEADSFGEASDFSGGFQRDGGPVMMETPQAPSAVAVVDQNASASEGLGAGELAAVPEPAADLGPLLNLPVPSLPEANAGVLPETIGSPRLRVAAERGDAAAAFEVATRFMEGRGVQQDLNAAAHWYGRAADQNLAPAAYRLGSFYEQGRGVDRSRDAAIAWYERAALGGNPRAMHNLAVMAADSSSGSPDFARAAAWFTAAANRGLPDSQFNLAVLFARGMGVERDLMESYKWFALAANAGDGEAVGRRDEVAAVLGDEALALATARVDNWRPLPIDRQSIVVEGPPDGWDDTPVRAQVAPSPSLIAEAQALLAQRGFDAGPADGVAGPQTSEAVRAFRQSIGLGDGQQIDQALIDALRNGTTL